MVEVGVVRALVVAKMALRARLMVGSLLGPTDIASNTSTNACTNTSTEAVATIEALTLGSSTLSTLSLSLALGLALDLRRLLHGTSSSSYANVLAVWLIGSLGRATTAWSTRSRVGSAGLVSKTHKPLHSSTDLPARGAIQLLAVLISTHTLAEAEIV